MKRRPRLSLDTVAPTVQTHGRLKTYNELSLPVSAIGGGSLRTTALDKPPYRVPLMSEIAALPRNGFSVVSTFSGCGGSCLGFEMCGYRILWASEFIPAAQETYRANHPGTILDGRDIRTIQPYDILRAINKDVGEIDVLEGSPPCASFSTAGKRQEGWGKVKAYSETKQRTDDLFFEYARVLKGLQPKVFVAENVSGLVKGVAKGYFKEILAALKACGYVVEAKLLDAQWLGVPQMRQRIIFMGVREDLRLRPVFPKPLSYRYSVRDALGGIAFRTKSYAANDWNDGNDPAAAIQASGQYFVEYETQPTMQQPAAWECAKPGGSGFDYSWSKKKVDLHIPGLTIGSTTDIFHPTERRKFTIAELKRICAFPDDFILTGSYSQRWERLGRAVPPIMMKAIAEVIRDQILNRLK